MKVKLQRPLISPDLLPQIRNGFVAAALLYCVWWNLSGTRLPIAKLPEESRWFGYTLRLDQHWGMFAPIVFRDDGWYILEGHTANGKSIDLNQQGKEVDDVKPASVMALFKNDRWRKYSENYLFVRNAFARPYYCNYLMRRWNENHPNQPITQLQVVYMKEPTLPDYQVPPPTREVLCICANEPEI